MLSQFGQKKKKEALRRLSQNAAHRQSLEGKTSKRTAIFRQKLSTESLSATKGPSDLTMKSVEHGEVDLKTEAFEMANTIPSVFGNVSTSSFGSSASFTTNQTFSSAPPNTQAMSGFPVVPTTVEPTFPFTSHTGFGFPVSSTFTTLSPMTTESSVGFPVSTAKFVGFSSFSGNDNSSKPYIFGKDFEENKTKTSTGLTIKPVDTFPVKSDSSTFVSGSEQRRSPLHQTQSFTSLSNVKSFGSKQTVQEEKITLPDISKLKSLVIREIPPGCNKNTWLRRFYSRFGEIVKVLCNSAKNSATVTFRTHEAAKLAKVKGRILQKGCQPVSIFWKQEKKRTSVSKDKQELSEKTEPVKQNIGEKPVMKEAVLSFDTQSLPIAISSGDKYKVLEMIDLKFREGLTKASDITTAKAVKGTCPDMCPEKERYMREDRRRLHTFEIVPGTGSMEENPLIDHARAVKEYDRSAADKEEPLPHELRPVKTLQMTMNYLVTNIMDVGEGRWAEWFDFLWNRTRAIRKDITQQHLCEPNAVDLIEKTARFHIFCSHYLCDQDFGVFDPKINTENLTKCLQTLKHFYDDLYKNQNITCPCEAEFRAYDILLNLNEGDILRQVMTYRKEVRSSPLVQFAMGIFNALNSNNSVRFFRLVRSSTYLCACLLHRYFTQVRQQAIRILNYSLSVPNKEMSYPLSELAPMLAFEDDNEAAMFCRFHGMTVNEPNVVFMRGSFIEPEAAFPLAKSLRLIESKRTSLIGEIVYNGPLPPNPNHTPTSSFNSNGQYIGESHILPTSPEIKVLSPKGFPKETHTEEGTFGVTKSPIQGFSQTQSYESNETLKPSVQINAEELKEVTKTLFLEVINELLVDVTNEVFEKVQHLLTISDDITREIEECSISMLIQEIVKSAILDEQRQQNMEAEQAAHREKASSALASDIVNEVIQEELYHSASFVYNIEHQKLVQHYEEMATEQITQNIIEQTVLDEIQKTVQESFKELKSLRKSTLQKISKSFMVTRKERYFKRWIKSYRSLVKLKGLLSNFPSHCSLASPEQQLSRLIGPQFDAGTCTFHTTRILRDEQNISETLSQRQAVLEKNRSEVLHSIDIPQLIAGISSPQFFTKTTVKSCMDWKLLLSFRNPCQDLHFPYFNQSEAHVNVSVIREKFSKGTITEKTANSLSGKLELLSLYSAEVPSALSTTKRCRICTLASYGILSNTDITNLTSSRQLQGTSAILIITESSELQSYSNRQELRIRVQRLLQSKPDIPAIPVVILFLDNSLHQDHITQDAVIDAVGIQHHSNHISEVTVIMLPSITEIQTLNDALKEAVTWLLQRSHDQLELESNSLKNYVEEGIQRYFWTSFYDDFATRKKAGLNDQCPEALIAMYNAVIEHLASVASSSKLCRVSWPIKEFCKAESRGVPCIDWNSEPSLSSLRSVILSLLLPPPPPRAENGLWDSEALLCQLYVKQIPQNSTYLAQRIDRLLHHKRLSLHESHLSAEEVPWTQVIEASISSLLTSLYSDPVLSNTEVHFFVNEIDAFEQPEIWKKAAFSSKEESTVELEKKRIQSSSMTSKDALIYESVQMIDKDLEAILKNSKMHSVDKKKQTTSLENSIIDLKGKLGTALQEARDDIVSFEKDIQRWLPDYYTESSKKRKAEAILHCQIPIMKSSRHSTDSSS